MKKLHLQKSSSLLLLLFTMVVVLMLTSCSRKMTFGKSQIVPGATGSVKIKKGKNNNYHVDLRTIQLAKPESLTPSKNVYVVWMRTEDNTVRNIGMIKSSSSLLSKALKGDMQATSTSKPTSFFITAEDDGNIQYPGNIVVLSTK